MPATDEMRLSRETREFVERVPANLWNYRARLGQAAPSLDGVASGRWPVYAPQESGAAGADNAGN